MAKKKKVTKKAVTKKESKTSTFFVSILAIVSIMGFAAIISESFFEFNITPYVDSLLLLAIGIGFIIESNPKKMFNKKGGLSSSDFPKLTTFVIGSLAIISGFLSLPLIGLQHFIFLAIKGLISIIVIIFIVVETWFLK